MAEVSLKHISFQYLGADEPALKAIDLEIEKGKLYAIIGPNGAGKTTICNIIRGFIPHFHKGEMSGDVLIQGQKLENENLGDLSQTVGFVFQNPYAQISQSKDTVFEELAFGLENIGVKKEQMIERINEILSLLKIDDLRDADPMALSGGQKQKVAFASIMVMNPDIYVIDEPTSQLDPVQTDMIFEIICLLKKQGKTIVLVEHKIELIAQYADQVIVLCDGEIKCQGRPREVFNHPQLNDWHVRQPVYTALAKLLNDSKALAVKKEQVIEMLKDHLGVSE